MQYEAKLKRYKKYLSANELSEGTQKLYITQARKFLEYVGDRELDKEMLVEYKEILLGRGKAASTYNTYIAAINGYLRFEKRKDLKIKMLRIQKKRNLKHMLRMSDYYRLLEHAKQSGRVKYYYIMKTLALTGARISELKYFTVEALDMKEIVVANKGKIREVCLPERLIWELKKYCRISLIKEGSIFRGKQGKPITRNAVYQMMQILAKEADINQKCVHPHNFRHLFAVTYMKYYSNIFELADLLGHANLETTRIYAVTSIEEKRRKLDKLGL